MKYKVGDIVKVHTFAGVDVAVKILERIEVPKERQWGGYGGWKTKLVHQQDVDKLIKAGVPASLDDEGWVFDWQVIQSPHHLDDAIKDCESEYEEEIELYKVYGGE